MRRANGEVLWIDGRSMPERESDGGTLWYGFLLDVTARKDAEIELENQRLRLKGIIDSAMDGIITVDEDYRIAVFNQAAERMFQHRAEKVLGQPLDSLIPQRFRSIHAQHMVEFARSGSANRPMGQFASVSGLRSNGEEFPIEASISQIELHGRRLFTVTCRDVTERRQAEAERRRLEEHLRQSQKMEAIGTLAGGIAHDFNNILGAILGNVELARLDTGPDHSAAESLEEIRKAGRRAKNLVQQILTFSRQQAPERRPLDLGTVVEEALRLLRATLPAGIELRRNIAAGTPPVLADSNQIHQLVLNLCTNAWHALETTGDRIEVVLDTVTLPPEQRASLPDLGDGLYVRLIVRDNGCGMDSATVQRVFEPFFTTKAPGKGTGLGLSVVHGIMKSHHGAIEVRSVVDKGTEVRLYFPVCPSSAPATPSHVTTPPRGQGESILYIDDEQPLVELATNFFGRLGYTIHGFVDHRTALETFRQNPGRFSMAVTDLNMPGTTGLNVAAELLRLRPDLPVVLTTGFITDELRESARKTGIRHVVYKPNTVDELCQAIHDLMAHPHQA
jgi:PAS domain S-box-containing protein